MVQLAEAVVLMLLWGVEELGGCVHSSPRRVEELATRVMSGMLAGQGEMLLKNYALVLQFLLRLRQVGGGGAGRACFTASPLVSAAATSIAP